MLDNFGRTELERDKSRGALKRRAGRAGRTATSHPSTPEVRSSAKIDLKKLIIFSNHINSELVRVNRRPNVQNDF